MHRKAMLGLAAVAVAVACFGTSTASAATLYTSSAHTTAVPVGTTFTAKMVEKTGINEWGYKVTANGNLWAFCTTGSYSFKVTQNSSGVFKALPTGGSLSGCAPYQWTIPPEVTPPPELAVTGSSTTVGTNKDWLGTNMTVYQITGGNIYWANFVGATGNPPANGIFVQQPGTTSPVSLVLNNAAGLNGPGLFGVEGGGHVTTTYTFTGTAAGYSFN